MRELRKLLSKVGEGVLRSFTRMNFLADSPTLPVRGFYIISGAVNLRKCTSTSVCKRILTSYLCIEVSIHNQAYTALSCLCVFINCDLDVTPRCYKEVAEITVDVSSVDADVRCGDCWCTIDFTTLVHELSVLAALSHCTEVSLGIRRKQILHIGIVGCFHACLDAANLSEVCTIGKCSDSCW